MRNLYRITFAFTLGMLALFVGALTAWADTPAPALDRIPLANTLNSDFAILNYVLVGKQRVGRSDYNYTYRADLENNGSDAQNCSATLSGASSFTTIIDDTLNFGNVDEGAVVTSADTFTIRQNRRYPFDPATLSWALEFENCPSPTMSVPELSAPLLSGITASVPAPFCYSGTQVLTFHLINGPSGMAINPASGVLSWNPPTSMEGQDALVSVSVTDGITINRMEFNLPVAATTPITSSVINNNTVTVVEPGNLQGLSITLPEDALVNNPIHQIEISRLDETQVPVIPEGIIRLSDFYRANPVNAESSIIMGLPTNNLPSGRYPFELILYTYTTVDASSGASYSTWVPTQLNMNINQIGQVTIETNSVGDASFIGIAAEVITGISSPDVSSEVFDGTTVSCQPKKWLIPNLAVPAIPLFIEIIVDSHQICTVEGDSEFQSDIYDFDDNNWSGSATVNKLAYWAYQAQGLFDGIDLKYDNKIKIRIHQLNQPNDPNCCTVGYVTTNDSRRTIHLDTDRRWSEDRMNTTTLHEYFHQAQSRTTVDGLLNIMDTNLTEAQHGRFAWVYEGTARWFEDYDISDNLNIYRSMSTLNKILNNGLDLDKGNFNEYKRSVFFKMLESSCNGFSIGDIVNVDLTDDQTGVENLASHLRSSEWDCDFHDGFGAENNNTLASALLYYQYSTVKQDDISLLDSNEDKTLFHFSTAVTQTLNPSTNETNQPADGVPANGARSYKIMPVGTVPVGKEIFVRVAATGDGAMVSFIENDINNSSWIDTTSQTEFVYGDSGSAPELFVTVVNPSTENATNVSITTGIRDIPLAALSFISPVEGQNYYHRVINVSGTLSSGSSGSISKVLIEQPNISGSMNIAKVSGDTFTGKAVIRLGQNTITVVGLDSNNNRITDPATITFTGVENPSSGLPNALIKSNMVYVLQWDTNYSDIDMYVTDPLNRAIWYGQRSISGVGIQDVDDTNGYGPEVTSFFTDGNAVEGNYEVNINSYSLHGAGTTHYTVDVLLNEGSNAPVTGYFYTSYPNDPLTSSSSGSGFPPSSSNSSWGADVINVHCSGSGLNMQCALD